MKKKLILVAALISMLLFSTFTTLTPDVHASSASHAFKQSFRDAFKYHLVVHDINDEPMKNINDHLSYYVCTESFKEVVDGENLNTIISKIKQDFPESEYDYDVEEDENHLLEDLREMSEFSAPGALHSLDVAQLNTFKSDNEFYDFIRDYAMTHGYSKGIISSKILNQGQFVSYFGEKNRDRYANYKSITVHDFYFVVHVKSKDLKSIEKDATESAIESTTSSKSLIEKHAKDLPATGHNFIQSLILAGSGIVIMLSLIIPKFIKSKKDKRI